MTTRGTRKFEYTNGLENATGKALQVPLSGVAFSIVAVMIAIGGIAGGISYFWN